MSKTTHCKWCAAHAMKKDMFKVRHGPIDWYFCNEGEVELWLEYKNTPEMFLLCRMCCSEKQAYLQGRSMEDEIFRLFPERCRGP